MHWKVYIENPKESTGELLGLIGEVFKVVRCKANDNCIFIHGHQAIRNRILITHLYPNMKHLVINLVKDM